MLNNPASNGQPKLQLKQTIIDNAFDAGIQAVSSSLNAENCLITNCGKNSGDGERWPIQFQSPHCCCLFNSFIQHKDPVLSLTNFLKEGNTTVDVNLTASFTNCIFWSENSIVENEVVTQKQGSSSFDVSFTNCLMKVKTNPANSTLTAVLLNQSPQFETIDTQKKLYNFRLKDGSPAIDAGIASGITIDLDGKPRPVAQPDAGCYEKQ